MSVAADLRPWLQGIFVGTVLNLSHLSTMVAKVEQNLDAEGMYEQWFTVVTQAGDRIRVTVEVEDG